MSAKATLNDSRAQRTCEKGTQESRRPGFGRFRSKKDASPTTGKQRQTKPRRRRAAAVATKSKLYKTNARTQAPQSEPPPKRKKQESENNIKQKRQAWTSATRASRRFVIVLAAPDLDERTGQTARIPAPGARRANPWRHRRRVFHESRRRLNSRGRARPPPKLHKPQKRRRRTTRYIR